MYVTIHARILVKLKTEITSEQFQVLINKLSDRFDWSYSFVEVSKNIIHFDHDGTFRIRDNGNGQIQFLDEVHRQSQLIKGVAMVDYNSSCIGNYTYNKGEGTDYNDMVELVDNFLEAIEGNVRNVRLSLKSTAT